MTATADTDAPPETTRTRVISWTDPESSRRQLQGLDGFERMAAIMRGEVSPAPAAALLGLSLDELERGRTVFSIMADELYENPMGSMHGGIVATLVDTAMGCAVVSTLSSEESFTTLELSTNFVRAITRASCRVHAEGRVVHGGGRIVTTDARVYDDAGSLYAHAKSTCMILRSAR
jgi:uncharacterized protein (TIGR00369 family)